jgi:hypothetical protein
MTSDITIISETEAEAKSSDSADGNEIAVPEL